MSLRRQVLCTLMQMRGVKKIQLGISFLHVFPGIPVDDIYDQHEGLVCPLWLACIVSYAGD